MLDLSSDQQRLVRELLARHICGREIRVFGSRATGSAKAHSDLDLALMGDEPLPPLTRAELMADFDDSDLPFRVDLLEWCQAPPTLREIVAREGTVLIPGAS